MLTKIITKNREIIENESLRIYFDSNFNRFESFGGREAMTRILLTAFRKQKGNQCPYPQKKRGGVEDINKDFDFRLS